MAREHAPSIIFMDEIDSIGSSRGESGSGGGDSEVQRTMLELLNQLDGFEATKNIKVRLRFLRASPILPSLAVGAALSEVVLAGVLTRSTLPPRQVIMATNRIDILDSALLRPGRIDRKIEFPPPGYALRPSLLFHARADPPIVAHSPEARVSILRIHSRKVRLSPPLPLI